MAKVNKVTQLRANPTLTEEAIQAHLDELNGQGWNLIGIDNLVGWYRFFWEKETE